MPSNTLNDSQPPAAPGLPSRPQPGTPAWFLTLAYLDWLDGERRRLLQDMGWAGRVTALTPVSGYQEHAPTPYWRAEPVMDAAGVDMERLACWALEAALRAANDNREARS